MSSAARLICVVVILGLMSSVLLAQEQFDSEAAEDSATEASALASEIADDASAVSDDANAVESFRTKADETASLLQQIATESAQGKKISDTAPLFHRAAALTLETIQMLREGTVTIDPAVASEFAQQFRELEKQYYARAAQPEIDAPATAPLVENGVAPPSTSP